MSLDPRTVMIVIIVGATLMGGALFVITRGSLGQIRGSSRWATATLLHAAGWFVIGPLRDVTPEVVWTLIGYGLLVLSLARYLIILADFTDTPVSTSWVYGAVVMQSAVLGLLWATGQGAPARTVVVAMVAGALMLKTSHLVLSGREGRLASHALTGSLFALCGSATLARGAYELFLAADPNRASWPSETVMNDVTYLAFYITATLLTFGFVLMVGHRYIGRQRLVEAELRESSILLSRAQQVAGLGSYKFEFSDGTWLSSPQLDELCGIDRSYPRNRDTWLRLIAPRFREEIGEFLGLPALLEHPRFEKECQVIRHSDGQERWVMAFGELEVDDDQKPVRLVGTVQDITERKRLEAEKENEGRLLELIGGGGPLSHALAEAVLGYEALFPGLRGSVLLLDPDGRRLRHVAAPHLPLAFWEAIDGVEIGPGFGSCGTAAHTGKTTMVADIATDPLWRDFRDVALRHGLQACWSVPILGAKDRVLGTFAFYADVPRAALPTELAALERGAHLVSLAIERQRSQEALKDSEARYRTLIEWLPEAVAVHRGGKVLYVNPATARILGATSPQDLVGRDILDFVHADSRPSVVRRMAEVQEPGSVLAMAEQTFLRMDGSPFAVEVHGIGIVYDGKSAVFSSMRDITDRKRSAEALRGLLSEKDALLKEVHHRVKNNLALITSLMRLETRKSQEPETRSALEAMQARIHSVMLLNETLYKTQHYSRVKLADYLGQMATHLFRAHNHDPGAVRLVLELDPLEVNTDQAIPCGLIVNELMTNSLKYAFAAGEHGEVRVRLLVEPYGRTRLVVSDTGAGLPADFEARRGQSLGLQLVADLAKQLRGTLDVGPGATFSVTFLPRLDHGTIEIPGVEKANS